MSSAGKQRTKRPTGSTGNKDKKRTPQQQQILTKIDIDIQAKPDVDDQQTSTGDILSTKLEINLFIRFL